MWICDVCGQDRVAHASIHPRSRCYSCETAEIPWRNAIAREIEEQFLLSGKPDTDDDLIHAIIQTVLRPLPPPTPTRPVEREMLVETVELLELEAGPIVDQPGLVISGTVISSVIHSDSTSITDEHDDEDARLF